MINLAQAALALDGDDPEVLPQASYIIALPGGDLSGGIALINKSIDLNPNSAVAFRMAGQLYAYAGDKQSAIAHLERAVRLNPVSRPLTSTSAMRSRISWRANMKLRPSGPERHCGIPELHGCAALSGGEPRSARSPGGRPAGRAAAA